MSHEQRSKAELYAIGAAVLWGTSVPAIGIALAEMSPMSIAFWRGIFQSVLLAGLMVAAKPRNESTNWAGNGGSWIVMGALALTGGFFNIGQALSIDMAGAAPAAFVAGLYPVAAVALAPLLLPESLGRSAIVGLGLAVAGVVLLLDPTGGQPTSLAGIGFAALAAVSFGAFLVLGRRLTIETSVGFLLPSLALVVGLAVMSMPAVMIVDGVGGLALPASSTSIWALSWLVVMSGVLPLILSELAFRQLPTRRTSPYMFLAPIVATALAIPLLGTRLSIVELAGGGLAVAGLVVTTWPQDGDSPDALRDLSA